MCVYGRQAFEKTSAYRWLCIRHFLLCVLPQLTFPFYFFDFNFLASSTWAYVAIASSYGGSSCVTGVRERAR